MKQLTKPVYKIKNIEENTIDMVRPATSRVTSSQICVAYLREKWEPRTMQSHESVYALYLNSKAEVIFFVKINKGSYMQTTFDLREVMQYAFNIHSDYIIVAHNHPCGKPDPSQADIELTKKIAEAFSMVDLFLLDHIVLTEREYFSFKDAGILPKGGYN